MKLDSELAKVYYTAAQAQKRLALDEQAFQYWIRKGSIKKIKLPGRSQGVYSRREVDDLASQIRATVLTEQSDGIEFREATPDDIEQEAQLAGLVFGEKAKSPEARRAFIQQNPHVDFHLYDKGQLVAYIDVIPLRHETITDFIEGRVIVWEIDPTHIEQFEPGKPIECLIADMITNPSIPLVKRTYYGRRLLKGLMNQLEVLGSQGIQITKIYAGSGIRTPLGMRILTRAGFTQIYERNEGAKIMYALDPMHSEKKIMRPYQEAFKQWQEQHQKQATSKRKAGRDTAAHTTRT